MVVHCLQVHKESITSIPNALPGRNSVDAEIYGMEGIPDDDFQKHIQKFEAQLDSNKRAKLDDSVAIALQNKQIASMSYLPPAPPTAVPLPFVNGGTTPPSIPSTIPAIPVPPALGIPPAVPGIPPVLPTLHSEPLKILPYSIDKPLAPSSAPPVPAPPTVAPPPPVPVVPEPVISYSKMVGTSRVVYADEELSMEERKAQLGKYQGMMKSS